MPLEKMICGENYTVNKIKDNINGLIDNNTFGGSGAAKTSLEYAPLATVQAGSYKGQAEGKDPDIHDTSLTKEIIATAENWKDFFTPSTDAYEFTIGYPNSNGNGLRKFPTTLTSSDSSAHATIGGEKYLCTGASLFFVSDAPKIEIVGRSSFSFILKADSARITEGESQIANDTYPYMSCVSFDMGSRKPRLYELIIPVGDFGFYGVVVAPEDTVYAAPLNSPKLMMVGDSISTNTGGADSVDNGFATFTNLLTQYLGIHSYHVSGIGGTGVSSNATGKNYVERLPDVVAFNPDILILEVSGNDSASLNIQEEWEAYLEVIMQTVKASTDVYVLGYFSTDTNTANNQKELDAFSAADVVSEKYREIRKIPITSRAVPPITADNESIMLADAVHPTTLGYIQLTEVLYRHLASIS
jgi:hypothetical protein